jgi:hypothetical protein
MKARQAAAWLGVSIKELDRLPLRREWFMDAFLYDPIQIFEMRDARLGKAARSHVDTPTKEHHST